MTEGRTTPVALDAEPKPRRRVAGLLVRLAAVGAAGLLVFLFITQWDDWIGARTLQSTDDAYVRSDITPLSSRVEGNVQSVPVTDFQIVKAGDLLVSIDDRTYRAQVAQAQADLSGAQAAIANLKALKALQHLLITEATDAIAATQADVDRTKAEAARQRTLLATSFGTNQKVEQAVAAERRLEATLLENRAQMESKRAQMAVLDTQEDQLRATVEAKQALLDLAKLNLGYTKIVAPVDGMVSERGVREGQYVHVGTQVISVVPLANVWVIANYKETQLTRVAVGQRATIAVDTFPGVVIGGRVEHVAPATGSQFSLLPPDNATGNFTKVVQRVPVKIALDPDNPLAGRLRPGLSVTATIHTNTPGKP